MEENKQETPVSQTPPTSGGQKMDEGKVMGILSYLSILCLIPLFTKKDDDFVYFHAKQGLVLFGFEIVVYVIYRIIVGMLIGSIVGWRMLSIWLGNAFHLEFVFNLVDLGLLVLAIMGIINVVQNKKKELPLIGKFARNLKF